MTRITSQTYDLKSSTKAIGVTAVGLALLDGKFGSLHEPTAKYHPAFGVPPETNEGTGWLEQITLFQLAAHTAGFDKNGGYTELLLEPGTQWSYSDGGPNWLAECVTLAYGRDLQELMFERVFSPMGIGRDDLRWRPNAYRPREIDGVARREFGSGIWVFTESTPFTAMPGDPVLAVFTLHPLPPAWWADIPTDRHSQGCNLSFADGHVEFHRWKAPKDSRSGSIHMIQPGGDSEDHAWLLDGLPRIE